jgi:hypothetical protein
VTRRDCLKAFAAAPASDKANPSGPETFVQFYERRTGGAYPGTYGETWDVVFMRIATVFAEWADSNGGIAR